LHDEAKGIYACREGHLGCVHTQSVTRPYDAQLVWNWGRKEAHQANVPMVKVKLTGALVP
jgi:hypothetical protein